ncbi:MULTISPECIES: TcmI family type II polyketide cyclase [unclassified Frankia]|uniref:TcmI family type II polyketide cyclase n=1 Tax=unclassified Frankia TaxID=2632575 RepID=UPI001EF6784C|nr:MULTISPECIES: TcmI family type II polyketide cyclase [unclassified Frankia]
MHRTLIVAKIEPGSQQDVARIFAESDTTGLPRAAGVVHRSLYSLGDLYIHLLETVDDGRRTVENARGHEEFKRVSDRLTQHIRPYLKTWRSPADAMAHCFYTFESTPRGEAA